MLNIVLSMQEKHGAISVSFLMTEGKPWILCHTQFEGENQFMEMVTRERSVLCTPVET